MSQLIACPDCKKHLQVPDDLMGKKVQCPECKHTFTAQAPEEEESSKTGTTASQPAPSKTPEWDKKSSSSSSRSESGKKKRRDDDDDNGDDDDDDDDRPRRRKRRSSSSNRGHYMPHRGGMILAFGIIGLVIMPIFGLIAWIMGNSDMKEIRAGRMDPEGEGMTNTGRILGMVAVMLWIASIVLVCGIFGCLIMLGAMGAAAGGRKNNFPPPRR